MLQYSFMQNALIISIFISILCPFIGTFLVLRRHSMMGDTLAHSSLAGVAIGIMLDFNPIVSSLIFTSICGVFIEYLRSFYKKYSELILVIVLTLSVGIAITIISTGNADANVNSYLFGSILTVSREEVITVSILSIISIIILIFLYDKLLYITFDEEGARIAGIKSNFVNYIFSLLVSATISVSIRIMGVLVLSSMLAVPVATALQLKKGFKPTLIYSMMFGFIDIIVGLVSSFYLNSAPGGTIALTSVIVLCTVMAFKKLVK